MTVLDITGQDRLGVVLAHALQRIYKVRMDGLISGGPDINTDRCEELIALGQEHGIRPTDTEISRAAFGWIAENGLAEPKDAMNVLRLVMGW